MKKSTIGSSMKFLFVLFFSLALVQNVHAASYLNVSFVSPTLTSNISGDSNNSWLYINVSYQNTSNLTMIVLNWNGTNETNTMICSNTTPSGACQINKTGLLWGNYSFYVFLNQTNSSNQTPIWSNYLDTCGTLTANRTLLTNVNISGNTCMVIAANNVTLDCKPSTTVYYITGNNAGLTYGVYTNGYDNATITNCVISSFDADVYLEGTSDNVTIYASTLNGSSSSGVYLVGSNARIYSNLINSSSNGVNFNGDGVTIFNNTIYNTASEGVLGDDVALHNNVNISYNVLQNFSDSCLYLQVQNSYIHNNTCSGSQLEGIWFKTGSTSNYIYGNWVWNTTAAIAGSLTNSYIYGNRFLNNTRTPGGSMESVGIYLPIGGEVGSNRIFNNVIYNNTYGILLNGSSSNYIYGNNVSYNTVSNLHFNCLHVIGICSPNTDSVNNTILNNTLQGGTYGFYDAGWYGSTVNNNLLNNSISGSSAASIVFDGACSNNVVDSTLSATYSGGAFDIVSNNFATSNTLVNVSFNKSAALVDSTSNFTVKWYAFVSVVENDSTTGISGANADFFNSLNTGFMYEALNLTTNSSGWTSRQNVTEYANASSGTTYNFTPHYILARKAGYSANFTQNNIVSQDSPVSNVLVFTVMLTSTAPYGVAILAPSNNTWAKARYLNITGICNSSTTPFINVTLNYNGTLAANASTVTNATLFYFNQSVTDDGYYYYNLTCYTNNSLYTTSSTNLLKVDSAAPNVTIAQPANGSSYFDNTSLTINITASDSLSGLDKAIANDSVWAGVFSASGNAFNLTNSTSLTAGTHCVAVTVNDSANNVNSSYVCLTSSMHAMTISNVHVIDVTQNTVTLGWDTSPTANEVVEYGLTTAYGSSYSNAAFAATHSAYINSLTKATVYHYRITSCSSASVCASTSDDTFTTAGGSGGGSGGGSSGGGYIPTATPTVAPSAVASPSASAAPTIQPSPIGGEKDAHGCLIAAGYSWCEVKQKCLRTWEEPCVVASASPSATVVTPKPVAATSGIPLWLIAVIALIILVLAYFAYARTRKKRGL